MFYERKVKYLDYLVKQERCSNAGYIKLEARDTVCNITIYVSNLRETVVRSTKVYLIGDGHESELCNLELVQGKGMKQFLRQDLHNIGGTGIPYKALEAVKIVISPEREIYGAIGQVEEEQVASEEQVAPEVQEASEVQKMSEEQVAPEMQEASKVQKVQEGQVMLEVQAATEHNVVNNAQAQGIETKCTDVVGKTIGVDSAPYEEASSKRAGSEKIQEIAERKVPLYDDKWKQLWEIYPHIAPFRDEREFLSLGPNDFVILPEKYYRMVNNSFLLHGYYNYKHLILKRMEYHGELRYYIGVPGNFYDREKQVAVMFGFESFESLQEPAGTGDYGYYLMRIEL